MSTQYALMSREEHELMWQLGPHMLLGSRLYQTIALRYMNHGTFLATNCGPKSLLADFDNDDYVAAHKNGSWLKSDLTDQKIRYVLNKLVQVGLLVRRHDVAKKYAIKVAFYLPYQKLIRDNLNQLKIEQKTAANQDTPFSGPREVEPRLNSASTADVEQKKIYSNPHLQSAVELLDAKDEHQQNTVSDHQVGRIFNKSINQFNKNNDCANEEVKNCPNPTPVRLHNDGHFVGISEKLRSSWKTSYPLLDLDHQLGQLAQKFIRTRVDMPDFTRYLERCLENKHDQLAAHKPNSNQSGGNRHEKPRQPNEAHDRRYEAASTVWENHESGGPWRRRTNGLGRRLRPDGDG